MSTRQLAAVCAALCVVLAGCGAFADGSGPTPDSDPDREGSASAPTERPGSTAGGERSNGSTAAGSTTEWTPGVAGPRLDASDLHRHRQALRETGSFAVAIRLDYGNHPPRGAPWDPSGWTNYTVDLDADRAIVRGRRGLGTFVRFTDGDTTYRQQKHWPTISAERAVYNASTEGQDDGTYVNPVEVADVLESEHFAGPDPELYDAVGAETVAGVAVTRYEADLDDLKRHSDRPVRAESFTGTVLVDADGVIRYSAWRYVFEQRRGDETVIVRSSFEIHVTDVGTATVADPPWLRYADTPEAFEDGVGPTACEPPSADGAFDLTRAPDGTRTVTYQVSHLGPEQAVILLANETGDTDVVLHAGETAVLRDVASETTVRVVAINPCLDDAVLDTLAVETDRSD